MNEVVPARYRGGLVTIHAVMFLVGYTVSGWVGVGFYFWNDPNGRQWRPPLAIQAVWPLLLLTGLYWVPESPRWLLAKGRVDEAKKILNDLHSDPADPENTFARGEFYQIQKQVVIDKTLESSWAHMFKKPSYRKRCFLAMGTTFFVSCSGVLVINSELFPSFLYFCLLISVRLWPYPLQDTWLRRCSAVGLPKYLAYLWYCCYLNGRVCCRSFSSSKVHGNWRAWMHDLPSL